ncbi:MAG: hypothetical protein FJ015_08000 [Chloroflexi bacterium]|nr:hypothetical protein [Chloroflexota bacterium]
MDEKLYWFTTNDGELKITTKKGDTVLIHFMGSSDGKTVQGEFQVTGGGGGTYAGTADVCVITCDPFTDLTCRGTYVPTCDGFYVDFTFTY